MSDTVCSGIVTKLTDGRFDGQYDVEIQLADGTTYAGADGISVYEKKKDGSESAVWPLVQESKFQGKAFTWMGNFRTADTKAGPKTYCTITWGQPDENWAPQQGPVDDWGTPPPTEPEPSQVPQSSAATYKNQGNPRTDKDKLITATAVTKSLIEGRYLTQENLESGVFAQLVGSIVTVIEKQATE